MSGTNNYTDAVRESRWHGHCFPSYIEMIVRGRWGLWDGGGSKCALKTSNGLYPFTRIHLWLWIYFLGPGWLLVGTPDHRMYDAASEAFMDLSLLVMNNLCNDISKRTM